MRFFEDEEKNEMIFMSLCNDCAICGAGNSCCAGNGDNDYFPATKEQIIQRLENGEYLSYTQEMKDYLYKKFDYEYKTPPQLIEKELQSIFLSIQEKLKSL